jgi:hypothetical protein
MARIRTIKPEFWTSDQVVECSIPARLLFIGIWNFCDDGGNHPYTPKTIKMQVFPGDDFTTQDIESMLAELMANKLIVRYTADGKQYLHVTGWKHQMIKKAAYKYPVFTASYAKSTPPVPHQYPTSTPPVPHCHPPEGNGRDVERNGMEVEGKGRDARAREIADDCLEVMDEEMNLEVPNPDQIKIPVGIHSTPGPAELRPWDEMTVEQCLAQLRGDAQFMESIERMYRIDRSIIPEWMDSYQLWKQARDGPIARLNDVRKHFLNWLRGRDLTKPATIFKDESKPTTKQKNGSGAQHSGFDLLIDELDDLIQDSLRDNPI